MTRSTPLRRAATAGEIVLATALALVATVAWLNVRGESPPEADASPTPATAEVVARGAYLARAGNCQGCHTATGGPAYAGGRGIETPFGTAMASNITPDADTGIGRWSAGEFRRALHHGRAKDGRLLVPAFPYPSFTIVTREDADALYAFLRTVPAVQRANEPHALRFPYGTQAALAVWRALYFRAGRFEPEPARDAAWNRGRYLTEGLGHCTACHAERNGLGGTRLDAALAGGLMPGAGWYAPSLDSPQEAGAQLAPRDELVRLLKNGVNTHATVSGPMAEVVSGSTQHLGADDLDAMARYLVSLPARPVARAEARRADPGVMAQGQRIYERHCADCHGKAGQGVPGIYPALAGNRAVGLAAHHNVVQTIRHGGFPPSTAGHPQPFGMPPFGMVLADDEIAAVASYIRQAWGNHAPAVSTLDVLRVD